MDSLFCIPFPVLSGRQSKGCPSSQALQVVSRTFPSPCWQPHSVLFVHSFWGTGGHSQTRGAHSIGRNLLHPIDSVQSDTAKVINWVRNEECLTF